MNHVIASWKRQPIAIRVLRAFLGLTFIYAGWDKVSDPSFLPKGFTDSVTGFAASSPISSLLNIAGEHPMLFGWLIIVSELAIGIFTLLGAAALPAALGGLALSLTLWLSSSWNVRPYFLAADPAYIVLWATYALSLPKRSKKLISDRREFNVALIGAAVVGAFAFLGKRTAEESNESAASPTKPRSTANGGKAKVIVALANVPVGGTHKFNSSQGAAILIRMTESKMVAYTTKCTHEGCTVQFNPGRTLLECPCHGATFDPAKDAAPTRPASRPLTKVNVAIQGSNIVEL